MPDQAERFAYWMDTITVALGHERWDDARDVLDAIPDAEVRDFMWFQANLVEREQAMLGHLVREKAAAERRGAAFVSAIVN